MPMLKTAPSGTTSVSGIKTYLVKSQRQEHESHRRDWEDYARGEIQLSEAQRGRLADYLGQQSRGLAVDVSDDLTASRWARQMDLTRKQYGHDQSARRGGNRTYYHFILSPSMDDDCTLSTIREYAKAWANENFRTGERLCEFAIVYHDDNAKGILHAHIVVNATNKHTKKKLHLSNKEVVRLELSAQEIGKKFGLTPIRETMSETVGARTNQPVYLDRKEREILSKGGYSWKWELREKIAATAALSRDFDDFKLRLNRAGFDVSKSEKTGYLTYTHRNGRKAKDSRLGARFYLESLQQMFLQEQSLDDQTYSTWELMKIFQGEIPWKEDIRRAIDAIAPTVLSIPELKHELQSRYGIRLIVNRRGITYQHSCGFKTRDVSIGLRYTIEGLRHNAVVDATLPHPGYKDILKESALLSQRYLPRAFKGAGAGAPEWAAMQFVYRDMIDLLSRRGATSAQGIGALLEAEYGKLRKEKAEIGKIGQELGHWNRLCSLQRRYEKDCSLLTGTGLDSLDPDTYNETLLRVMRVKRYLEEQAEGKDIPATREKLQIDYEKRLSSYQEKLSDLDKDTTIYRNYLMLEGAVSSADLSMEDNPRETVQGLFRAAHVLEANRVRDYFHLEQMVSACGTQRDLARFKYEKAFERKQCLESIRNDVMVCLDAKEHLPTRKQLADHADALGLEDKAKQYQEARHRLDKLGIGEAGYEAQLDTYEEATFECDELHASLGEITAKFNELKETQRVCLTVADSLKTLPSDFRGKEMADAAEKKDKPEPIIPVDDAKRRIKSREIDSSAAREKDDAHMR